jgi:hypothetical protein
MQNAALELLTSKTKAVILQVFRNVFERASRKDARRPKARFIEDVLRKRLRAANATTRNHFLFCCATLDLLSVWLALEGCVVWAEIQEKRISRLARVKIEYSESFGYHRLSVVFLDDLIPECPKGYALLYSLPYDHLDIYLPVFGVVVKVNALDEWVRLRAAEQVQCELQLPNVLRGLVAEYV